MKKTTFIIATLIFCCFTFWFCEKNALTNIEIHGRVLNFWDKSPMPSQVQLWVGGSMPGTNGTTNYGNFATNADGSFDVKSNGQWNGNDYTLVFIPANTSGDEFNAHYTVSNNQNLNAGDILTGHVTIVCKITLNSVSGASINFLQIGSAPQTTFTAGTHTVITASSYYDSDAIKNVGNFYPITYSLSTGTTDTTIMVPLHPPADTASVTINY